MFDSSIISLSAIGILALVSGIMALTRRNLIHAALLLILTWLSIAFFYLWAGAEFVAFAQIIVYIGAVSMIVLFAVVLTKRKTLEIPEGKTGSAGRICAGVLTSLLMFAVLAYAIVNTQFPVGETLQTSSVKQIGEQLIGPQMASVLILGVILTATLIGAVLIAAPIASEKLQSKEESK